MLDYFVLNARTCQITHHCLIESRKQENIVGKICTNYCVKVGYFFVQLRRKLSWVQWNLILVSQVLLELQYRSTQFQFLNGLLDLFSFCFFRYSGRLGSSLNGASPPASLDFRKCAVSRSFLVTKYGYLRLKDCGVYARKQNKGESNINSSRTVVSASDIILTHSFMSGRRVNDPAVFVSLVSGTVAAFLRICVWWPSDAGAKLFWIFFGRGARYHAPDCVDVPTRNSHRQRKIKGLSDVLAFPI